MDIEKAPLISITEKHDKCNGTGIIESDIDRHCYCDEGIITRFANREEQRDADHEYYTKVVEQAVKAELKQIAKLFHTEYTTEHHIILKISWTDWKKYF